MFFFKTNQQKINNLMEELAGKARRLEYMQRLKDDKGNVPWSEIADLHERIAVISEKLRNLSNTRQS